MKHDTTMEERFKIQFTNIGSIVISNDVPVKFIEREKEVLDFINAELALAAKLSALIEQ